jgi:DNA-binding CsgD family transcriptional regulator
LHTHNRQILPPGVGASRGDRYRVDHDFNAAVCGMSDTRTLRPLERRVLQLVDDGVDDREIGRRFRRSPGMIRRIIDLTEIPRSGSRSEDAPATGTAALRPLEQRVLRWRDGGSDYVDIGRRFGRSADHVRRVEELARYKLRSG